MLDFLLEVVCQNHYWDGTYNMTQALLYKECQEY